MTTEDQKLESGTVSSRGFTRLSVWLIIFQFLACPVLLLRDQLPPVVGLSQFSVAIDFRYFQPALIGFSLGLPLLLAFLLAWSPKSLRWRLFVAAPLLLLAVMLSTSAILFAAFGLDVIFVMSDVVAQRSILLYVSLICLGMIATPLALRAYAGWHLSTQGDLQQRMTRGDRIAETIFLAIVVALALLGGQVLVYPDGIGIIFAIFGIGVGCVMGLFVYWLFNAERTIFAFCFAFAAIIFFILPVAAFYLNVFIRIGLPPGSSRWLVGAAVMFGTLLAHVLLYRAIGYRMCRFEFEEANRSMASGAVVTDPFSD